MILRAFFLTLAFALTSFTAFAQSDRESCATAYERAQYARRDLKLREARANLLICAQRSCTAAAADCAEWLREVETALPSVVFEAHAEDGSDLAAVTVSIDEQRVADNLDGAAIFVDPGKHTVLFESAGREPQVQTFTFQEGEKSRRIQVVLTRPKTASHSDSNTTPTEPSRSRGSLVAPLVLGGVGVAAIAVSIVVGIEAKNDLDNLRGKCAGSCPSSDLDPIKRTALISDILLGVGIAGVGAGVVLFVLGTPSHNVALHAHASGIDLQGHF